MTRSRTRTRAEIAISDWISDAYGDGGPGYPYRRDANDLLRFLRSRGLGVTSVDTSDVAVSSFSAE